MTNRFSGDCQLRPPIIYERDRQSAGAVPTTHGTATRPSRVAKEHLRLGAALVQRMASRGAAMLGPQAFRYGMPLPIRGGA
jgi:hypothetical protein